MKPRSRIRNLPQRLDLSLEDITTTLRADPGTWYRVRRFTDLERANERRRQLVERFSDLEVTVTLGGVLQARAVEVAEATPRWTNAVSMYPPANLAPTAEQIAKMREDMKKAGEQIAKAFKGFRPTGVIMDEAASFRG